jgi:membrane protease YdiL (CAAX protease family)
MRWTKEMNLPGVPSLLLLFYTIVWLPLLVIYGASRAEARGGKHDDVQLPLISDKNRNRVWLNTLFQSVVLLVLSCLVGQEFDFGFLDLPRSLPSALLMIFFGVSFALMLRSILRLLRSKEESKHSIVFSLVPRTPSQWLLKGFVIIVGCIAVEFAYRGVCWAILNYSLGSVWTSALICSVAFALIHWIQGWKVVVMMFFMAVMLHAVVWACASVLPAIAIHLIYDTIAVLQIAAQRREMDQAMRNEA